MFLEKRSISCSQIRILFSPLFVTKTWTFTCTAHKLFLRNTTKILLKYVDFTKFQSKNQNPQFLPKLQHLVLLKSPQRVRLLHPQKVQRLILLKPLLRPPQQHQQGL